MAVAKHVTKKKKNDFKEKGFILAQVQDTCPVWQRRHGAGQEQLPCCSCSENVSLLPGLWNSM